MSDSYQAIYDAVRSRISGGNISQAVHEALRDAGDWSHIKAMLQQETSIAVSDVRDAMTRPSVLMRPALTGDAGGWLASYGGENKYSGVVGMGFDAAWVRAMDGAAETA